MHFGEKLVMLRKARGMTQEQLAAALSISRQAVSKWELGEAVPETENIVQLSRFFGVTTDYLLLQENSPAQDPSPCQQEAAPAQNTPTHAGKGRRIAGWILAGLGALGMLTLWVLSTMFQSTEKIRYTDEAGVFHYTSRLGYSLNGFIEKYRLEALFGVCIACLAVGFILLLWRRLWHWFYCDAALPDGSAEG